MLYQLLFVRLVSVETSFVGCGAPFVAVFVAVLELFVGLCSSFRPGQFCAFV